MIDSGLVKRLRSYCEERLEFHQRLLAEYPDANSLWAGMAIGSSDAYQDILEWVETQPEAETSPLASSPPA